MTTKIPSRPPQEFRDGKPRKLWYLGIRFAHVVKGHYYRYPKHSTAWLTDEEAAPIVHKRLATAEDLAGDPVAEEPASIDSRNVEESSKWIASIETKSQLWDIEQHELANKNRKGVLEAITDRLAELEEE